MLVVNEKLSVPLREFDFSFARSSGPGGQNVNKVNTKATLRWKVGSSSSLPASVRDRFIKKFSKRINAEGELIVTSQRFRDQGRNVADCLAKLRDMIAQAAVTPRRRKRTKPTRASKHRRLSEKKQQSEKKRLRRKPRPDD